MKKISLVLVFFLLANFLRSQAFRFVRADEWSETPKQYTIDPLFADASAVGLLDNRVTEYKVEDKDLAMYTSYHYIIYINNDKGIEMYNKIYVPVYGGSTVSALRARTILKDGKVIDLPAEKIKEVEQEGTKYKLFAMEGVSKGSKVEYSYTIKRDVAFFGTEIYQNSNIPYQDVKFFLSVPSYLKFDVKGYNGFKVSSDSVINETRVVSGYDTNVPEIDEEKYAVRSPYLKRVEYKLSYNISKSDGVRLYTWKEFAKKAYSFYTAYTPKEEKLVQGFIDGMKVKAAPTDEEKVKMVEDYIKTNFNVDKNLVGEAGGSIEQILKSKNGNIDGITRLFAITFEKLNIDYQIVFPGKRDELPLDEELENWNRMETVIFHFPATKKYLSPSNVELRYPFITPYWAGARGLFLKGTSIGTFKTAIGSFGEVMLEPYEKSAINLVMNVKFDESLDTLVMNTRQIFQGYAANNYRPIYTFLPKDKQDELSREIIKGLAKSTIISNIQIENPELTSYWQNKPLVIAADVKSFEMIEKAGNNILLKVGELIGQQAEMYQEKPRQLPLELEYPHALERKIALQIPAGYKIKNIDDLKLQVTHKEGDDVTMGFVSSYEQSGNTVNITITETYRRMKYPIDQFKEFTRVINAAADFNKVVLVLVKS